MIPNIEIETVPVPADNELRRNGDAPNMIRNLELIFDLQRLLIAPLDHSTTIAFVLGNRQPHGGLIRGETSRVEPISVLYLDRSQQVAGFTRKFLEISLAPGG